MGTALLDSPLRQWLRDSIGVVDPVVVRCAPGSVAKALFTVAGKIDFVSAQSLEYEDPVGLWIPIILNTVRDFMVENLTWLCTSVGKKPVLIRVVRSRGGAHFTRNVLMLPVADQMIDQPSNHYYNVARVYASVDCRWPFRFCRGLVNNYGRDNACMGGQLALYLHKTYADGAVSALQLYRNANLLQLSSLEPLQEQLSRKREHSRENVFDCALHCLNNLTA